MAIRHFSSAAILIAVALTLIVAVSSAVVSGFPLEEIRTKLDALTPDGSADDFPPARIAGIQMKLRVLAFVMAILAVLLVTLRRRLLAWICEAAAEVLDFLQHLRAEAHRHWAQASRLDVGTLAMLTLVAFLVRIAFLQQPMRTDEATTFLEFVSKPLFVGLAYYPAANNHIFHTALSHVSFLVFGGQEWAIRLPAFVAGVLVVPATYVAAGIHYGRVAAPIAAALVAVSSELILYSTNARGYTLLCFFFLSLMIVASCLVSGRWPGAWLIFVVVAALGAFTVPIMAFAIGVSVTWIISERLARRGTRPLHGVFFALISTALLTLLFYTPALVATGSKVLSDDALARSAWYHNPTGAFRFLARIWARWNSDLPTIGVVLTSGAAVYALVRHRKLGRRRVSIGTVTLLCWLPVLLALPATPFTRIFVLLLPVYWILAAGGIAALAQPLIRRAPAIGRATVAGLCITGSVVQAFSLYRNQTIYWSKETGYLRDAPALVSYLKEELRPGDRVVPDAGGRSILAYYFYREAIPLDHILLEAPGHVRTIHVIRKSEERQRVREVTGDAPSQPRLIKQFPETLLYELSDPSRE